MNLSLRYLDLQMGSSVMRAEQPCYCMSNLSKSVMDPPFGTQSPDRYLRLVSFILSYSGPSTFGVTARISNKFRITQNVRKSNNCCVHRFLAKPESVAIVFSSKRAPVSICREQSAVSRAQRNGRQTTTSPSDSH
jgi:hypothetical protein